MTREATEQLAADSDLNSSNDPSAASHSENLSSVAHQSTLSFNLSVLTNALIELKAVSLGHEEALEIVKKQWRASLGIQAVTAAITSNHPSSAFCDFKDEFSHVNLKLNNKLAGALNYNI
ncbi:hypothetical protein BDFG_05235 [Blastomyces dermatitidis ATCC 26199]|nr:hypothetical protein BDFG_05235 [Blastomyces dermatitidis ATCC 26199]